jgi:hypothetical protein
MSFAPTGRLYECYIRTTSAALKLRYVHLDERFISIMHKSKQNPEKEMTASIQKKLKSTHVIIMPTMSERESFKSCRLEVTRSIPCSACSFHDTS